MNTLFFCGFKKLSDELTRERTQIIKDKGGKELEDINVSAYYIPVNSQNTSDNVIVFAHTSGFLQLPPRRYDYLKNSADVVLWNPSKFNPCQYKKDLQSVVTKVRQLHPYKTVTIIGYCATVDPTIAVAADLKDRRINVILDRGHGNVSKLARSLTIFSWIPIVTNLLSRFFDCKGEEKIKEIHGKILFLHSEYDQMMRFGKQDLTRDLIKQRGTRTGDEVLKLQGSDHWARWGQETARKIYAFIGLDNVNLSVFPKNPTPSSFFSRNIFPYLMHTWI